MEAGANKSDPKSEGKGGEEDLSMEEILQSIRRIIADDDTDGKKASKAKASDDDVPGSDMLELTDMIKEDGTVVDLKKEVAAPVAPKVEEPVSFDILNQIDEALVEKPAAAPASEPELPPMVASAPPEAAKPVSQADIDSLLSSEAANATAEAFKRLKTQEPEPAYAPVAASPMFSSGNTVEGMVVEMLRPMLKQWLDSNLPTIVQQIVEREVRKLTK